MNATPRLAVFAAALAAFAPAVAQDFSFSPALNIGTLGVTAGMGEATKQMFGRYARPGSSASARAHTTKARTASLAFRPSQAVRKRVVEAFVRDTNRNDPVTAQKMRALFAHTDPIVSVGKDLSKYGLKSNNLATGMTAYLVQSWYAAHGKTTHSRSEYQAVARQAAEVFGSNPALARASDAAKQEAAEALMLYGALFEEGIVQAKKTQPSMIPRLRTAIAAHAKGTLGFDLSSLRLGANGFY